jgi:hypothetical protein
MVSSLVSSVLMAHSAWAVCGYLTRASLVSEPLAPALVPSDAPFGEGFSEDAATFQDVGSCAPSGTVVNDNTTCQRQSTIPSLWWAKAQYGGKLLVQWFAYLPQGSRTARVDVMVNQQFWSSIGYLDRYRFVTQFGSAASQFGYNSRVFDQRGTCLAAYTCNYDQTGNATNCQLLLPIVRRSSL